MENKITDRLNRISVGNDQYSARRGSAISKYKELFDTLRPGMCLRMPAEDVGPVTHALCTYIKQTGKDDHLMVRTVKNYHGAKAGQTGRVWLLSKNKESNVSAIKKAA